MRKMMSLLMVLCMMPFAFAQTDVAAGISPDSLFYGIDVWWDNVQLNGLAGEAKAQKALQIAEERAAEMEQMMLSNNEKARTRAQQEHQLQLANFENAEKSLTEQQRINMQVRFERHIQNLEKVLANAPEQAKTALQDVIKAAETQQMQTQNRISIENRMTEQEMTQTASQIRVTTEDAAVSSAISTIQQTGMPTGMPAISGTTDTAQQGWR